MTESLRRDLTDLAEDVTMVDLRDRALGESRRRTVRRRAGVAAGVAVALVLVATAAWPRPTSSVQPIGPTPSVSTPPSPSVSASPEPTTPPPSTSASPAAGAPRPAPELGAWQSSPGPSLPGAVAFLSYRSGTVVVNELANGTLRSAPIGGPVPPSDCVYQSATISPDGRKVAVVLGDAGGTGGDELYVIWIDGGPPMLVARGVSCSGSRQPIWMVDSGSLRVIQRDLGVAFADLNGVLGIMPDLQGYVAFAPGGAYRTVSTGFNSFAVQTDAGVLVRRVDGIQDDTAGGAVALGLSADGRYAAVGHGNTDPQVVRSAARVIDTVTGADVPPATLLGQGGEVHNVVFLAGGGLVVQGGQRWYLLSGLGKVTATVNPAPGEIRIGQFAYRP
jgi:hypothetical protein